MPRNIPPNIVTCFTNISETYSTCETYPETPPPKLKHTEGVIHFDKLPFKSKYILKYIYIRFYKYICYIYFVLSHYQVKRFCHREEQAAMAARAAQAAAWAFGYLWFVAASIFPNCNLLYTNVFQTSKGNKEVYRLIDHDMMRPRLPQRHAIGKTMMKRMTCSSLRSDSGATSTGPVRLHGPRASS